jgi:hypothetical protein
MFTVSVISIGNYEEVRRAVHECANSLGKTVHIDQNHCWTYMAIQSLTGVNVEPKMEEKKKGFKGMMSRYSLSISIYECIYICYLVYYLVMF